MSGLQSIDRITVPRVKNDLKDIGIEFIEVRQGEKAVDKYEMTAIITTRLDSVGVLVESVVNVFMPDIYFYSGTREDTQPILLARLSDVFKVQSQSNKQRLHLFSEWDQRALVDAASGHQDIEELAVKFLKDPANRRNLIRSLKFSKRDRKYGHGLSSAKEIKNTLDEILLDDREFESRGETGFDEHPVYPTVNPGNPIEIDVDRDLLPIDSLDDKLTFLSPSSDSYPLIIDRLKELAISNLSAIEIDEVNDLSDTNYGPNVLPVNTETFPVHIVKSLNNNGIKYVIKQKPFISTAVVNLKSWADGMGFAQHGLRSSTDKLRLEISCSFDNYAFCTENTETKDLEPVYWISSFESELKRSKGKSWFSCLSKSERKDLLRSLESDKSVKDTIRLARSNDSQREMDKQLELTIDKPVDYLDFCEGEGFEGLITHPAIRSGVDNDTRDFFLECVSESVHKKG